MHINDEWDIFHHTQEKKRKLQNPTYRLIKFISKCDLHFWNPQVSFHLSLKASEIPFGNPLKNMR